MLGASVRRDVVDAGHTTVRQETAHCGISAPPCPVRVNRNRHRQTRRWPMSGIGPKAARLTDLTRSHHATHGLVFIPDRLDGLACSLSTEKASAQWPR